MKRDLYLDKYIKLLEGTTARAHKDLDRERKRVDFLEGKVERLELVVMGYRNEAGREYAERSDQAAAPPAPRKPPITHVPAAEPRVKFTEIREKWNSMTAEQQEEAVKNGDVVVDGKPA